MWVVLNAVCRLLLITKQQQNSALLTNKYKGSESQECSTVLMYSSVSKIITIKLCASWERSHGKCDDEEMWTFFENGALREFCLWQYC